MRVGELPLEVGQVEPAGGRVVVDQHDVDLARLSRPRLAVGADHGEALGLERAGTSTSRRPVSRAAMRIAWPAAQPQL